MEINDITNNYTGTVTRVANKELGRDEFFKIFAAELQNQDPSEPMDSRESISQLAQFSSLEQMLTLTNRVEELKGKLDNYIDFQASAGSAMLMMNSAGLIGKNIAAEVDGVNVEGLVQSVIIKDYLLYAVTNNGNIPINLISAIY